MVDRLSRNRVVGRRGRQGACCQFLPRADVAGRGRVNHPAPHGAVLADSGHDDPHQLILSPSTTFRQWTAMILACRDALPGKCGWVRASAVARPPLCQIIGSWSPWMTRTGMRRVAL